MPIKFQTQETGHKTTFASGSNQRISFAIFRNLDAEDSELVCRFACGIKNSSFEIFALRAIDCWPDKCLVALSTVARAEKRNSIQTKGASLRRPVEKLRTGISKQSNF